MSARRWDAHGKDRGQRFAFHGYRFQVLRRQRNQITALRVEKDVAMEDELGGG